MQTYSDVETHLRAVILWTLNSQQAERNHLARALHNEVCQNLTALGLQIESIRLDLETIAPQAAARLSFFQAILDDTVNRIRDLNRTLNPVFSGAGTLTALLRDMLTSVQVKFGIETSCLFDSDLEVSPRTAAAMYRFMEIALHSAIHHFPPERIRARMTSAGSQPTLALWFDYGDARHLPHSVPEAGLYVLELWAAQAGLKATIQHEAQSLRLECSSECSSSEGGTYATPGDDCR